MVKITKKQAEQEYNKYLKMIHKKYGNKTTSSHELHKIAKKMFGRKFIGVFASDQIPVMKTNQYAIVNLDTHLEPGSHWVGVVKENDKTYVYDSFGRKTFKILKELIHSGNGVILETENDPEQLRLEDDCGQRTLSFLCVYDKYKWDGAKWI